MTAKNFQAGELAGRWLQPALLFLSLLAVFKGIHRPDRWGATQMETDYSAGFIKRGLFGEVLRHLHVSHYNQIVVLSLAATLLLIVQLSLLAYRQLARYAGTRSAWMGGVFMTSFALTYLVSLTGHLEIFLAALALAVLAIRRSSLFLIAAIPATVVGLLIHELFLMVFVPLLALRALLDAVQEKVRQDRDGSTSFDLASYKPKIRSILSTKAGMGFLLLLVVSVVTTLFLSATPSLTAQRIVLLRQAMIVRLDFPPREWLFAVFARGIGDNLHIMGALARTPRYWISRVESILVFGPPAAFFLCASFWKLRQVPRGGLYHLLRVAILVASLSPLALHLFGFDVFRFDALVVLTSFVAMALVWQYPVAAPSQTETNLPSGWQGMAAFLIALNLGSGTGLLDSQQVQLFPQVQSIRYGMEDVRAILRHRPLSLPYEPWKEIPWDPSNPTYSGLQCLDDCGSAARPATEAAR